MIELSALLRQTRLDKQMGLRAAGEASGVDPVLFSQIEGKTESVPIEGEKSECLASFLALDMPTYVELAKKHNAESPSHKADRATHFQKMMTVREAIVATGLPKGVVECPICKGKLHFTRAINYNGHVHAMCETDHCLGWIE